IVVAGRFREIGGWARTNVARLFPDGRVDPSFDLKVASLNSCFGIGPNSPVNAVAIQADGRAVLGGMALGTNCALVPTVVGVAVEPASSIARLLPDPAQPPVIWTHPADTTNWEGRELSLRVEASPAPLSYQWTFRGTNLPGATNPVLRLRKASLDDS